MALSVEEAAAPDQAIFVAAAPEHSGWTRMGHSTPPTAPMHVWDIMDTNLVCPRASESQTVVPEIKAAVHSLSILVVPNF